jgi:hypothetical protein
MVKNCAAWHIASAVAGIETMQLAIGLLDDGQIRGLATAYIENGSRLRQLHQSPGDFNDSFGGHADDAECVLRR